MGKERQLHDEKFHDLYSSLNLIKMIKTVQNFADTYDKLSTVQMFIRSNY
jgi:hypothetical protein